MSALGFGARLAVQPLATAAAGFDFTAGVLPAGATLTRGSAAYRTAQSGLLASVGADVARFDYDASTGALRGLLIEAAATNLLLQSSGFEQAAWTKSGASVIADGAAAPDGSGGADVLTDASGSAFASVSQVTGASGAVVASLYLAKDSVGRASRYPLLRMQSPQADLYLDTATGDFTATGGTGGVIDHGGFWRAWVAASAGTTLTLYPAVAAGATLGGGNVAAATGAVAAWGAQLEAGTVPSSLVATAGASGNRAADVLVLNWASRGVPDGAVTVRYTFDDGSTQDGALTVAAGAATVPTNLARRRIRSVVRV